jgi:anaerobic ribonucleoside-triphosphate reductase
MDIEVLALVFDLIHFHMIPQIDAKPISKPFQIKLRWIPRYGLDGP